MSSPGQIRVLVVDDYPDAAELLTDALVATGYDVLTATDGLRAIELAQEHAPAAAFVDIGMPNMDGYEVARRFRALSPFGPEMFLVALTGHSSDADKRRALQAGFDMHLVKPINLREIASVLAQRFKA
jgi:CheY-like chemotaxis protein